MKKLNDGKSMVWNNLPTTNETGRKAPTKRKTDKKERPTNRQTNGRTNLIAVLQRLLNRFFGVFELFFLQLKSRHGQVIGARWTPGWIHQLLRQRHLRKLGWGK